MSMQDTISDMLVRIKNAQMAKHKTLNVPKSKHKLKILEILKDEGFIAEFQETGLGVDAAFNIRLKYFAGRPVIETLKRVSKPGLRVYRNKDNLPTVNSGMGVSIVSTSKGVMTDKNARLLGLGGEIICTVS